MVRQNGTIDYGGWDNIRLLGNPASGIVNPNFYALLNTANTANLFLSTNVNNHECLVVLNQSGSFSPPIGSIPNLGEPFAGGTLVYRGWSDAWEETLDYEENYYFKAFSYHNGEFSPGVVQSIQTLGPEPSYNPSNVHLLKASPSSLHLAWEHESEPHTADGFLLEIRNEPNFTDYTDGVDSEDYLLNEEHHQILFLEADQTDVLLSNLSYEGNYHIRIVAFRNSDEFTDYNADHTNNTLITNLFPKNKIIFTEIVDPEDIPTARFVELQNLSDKALDLNQDLWYVCRQINAAYWNCAQLEGVILPGRTYVVAYSESIFEQVYHFWPEFYSGAISGNGDDSYFLYYGGNYLGGELLDIYGELDVMGTEEPWNYLDSRAERLVSVSQNNGGIMDVSEWVISPATTEQCTPGKHYSIWKGLLSSAWNNPGNWSLGLPLEHQTALIPTDYLHAPELLEETIVDTLIIASGAELRNHTLLSEDCVVEMHFELSGWTSNADGWHLISAPLQQQAIHNSTFTQGNYDFYQYQEANNLWLNQKNPEHQSHFEQFLPGRAYLVAYEQDKQSKFEGIFHTEDLVLNNLSRHHEGWHLVGNPFPSSLVWNQPDWQLSSVSPYAYRINASGTAYDLIFSGDTISPMEGFWIQVTEEPGSLVLPAGTNQSNPEPVMVKSKDRMASLTLRHENTTQTIYLEENTNATLSFDAAYDARYLPPVKEDIFQFFCLDENSNELTLNSFPPSDVIEIPLQTLPRINGTYHWKYQQSSDFNFQVYLIDHLTSDTLDLNQHSELQSVLMAEAFDSRFSLLLHQQQLSQEQPGTNEIRIHFAAGSIHFSNWIPDATSQLEVYNSLGQRVFSHKIGLNDELALPHELSSGVYHLSLTSKYGKESKSIVIPSKN